MSFNFVPLSPESDVFSTPPTSPTAPGHRTADADVDSVPPTSAATKRGARPQQLSLDPTKSRKGGIELERTPRDGLSFSVQSIPDINEQSVTKSPIMSINEQTLKSPCFVHSQLEKGASLVDWLKQTHINGPVSVAKSLSAGSENIANSVSAPSQEDEEDEQFSRSLTRQLAETAVGVREMSKALGGWLDPWRMAATALTNDCQVVRVYIRI